MFTLLFPAVVTNLELASFAGTSWFTLVAYLLGFRIGTKMVMVMPSCLKVMPAEEACLEPSFFFLGQAFITKVDDGNRRTTVCYVPTTLGALYFSRDEVILLNCET